MTRFIAIVSGKGGTGKTTAALNLATALTNFGREIVLVDANLSTPNISIELGSPKLPFTLHDALKGKRHITEAAYLHPSGMKLIPANFSLEEYDEENFEKLKDVLLDLVGTAEVVLLDAPSGISNDVRSVLEAADELLIVANPKISSVTEALKTIKIAENMGKDKITVVLNRTKNSQFEMSKEEVEALLDMPITEIIPEDENIDKASEIKHPVVYTHPDSPSSIAFKQLAAKLINEDYSYSLKEKGFFDNLIDKTGL